MKLTFLLPKDLAQLREIFESIPRDYREINGDLRGPSDHAACLAPTVLYIGSALHECALHLSRSTSGEPLEASDLKWLDTEEPKRPQAVQFRYRNRHARTQPTWPQGPDYLMGVVERYWDADYTGRIAFRTEGFHAGPHRTLLILEHGWNPEDSEGGPYPPAIVIEKPDTSDLYDDHLAICRAQLEEIHPPVLAGSPH